MNIIPNIALAYDSRTWYSQKGLEKKQGLELESFCADKNELISHVRMSITHIVYGFRNITPYNWISERSPEEAAFGVMLELV